MIARRATHQALSPAAHEAQHAMRHFNDVTLWAFAPTARRIPTH